jgi:putative membrane protein
VEALSLTFGQFYQILDCCKSQFVSNPRRTPRTPNGAILHPFTPGKAPAATHMPTEEPARDPRVYLAAERTFLAWIRTGLALMAFGFVVARFGLFLRELQSVRGAAPAAPSVLSPPLGVGLVLLGVLLNIIASWHHVRYVQQLNEGSLIVGRPSWLAIILALILAGAGLALAVYLAFSSTR